MKRNTNDMINEFDSDLNTNLDTMDNGNQNDDDDFDDNDFDDDNDIGLDNDFYNNARDNPPSKTWELFNRFLESKLTHIVSTALMGIVLGFLFQNTSLWAILLKVLSLSILFILLRRCLRWQTAGLTAWLFGTVATLTGMRWLYTAMHDIGGLSANMAMLGMVLFGLLLGAFNGVAGALFGIIKRRTYRFNIPFAATWTLGEWLRTWVLTGMPWMSIGYGFLDSPFAGIAPSLGVLGVGAAVNLVAASLARLVVGEPLVLPLPAHLPANLHKLQTINYFRKTTLRESINLSGLSGLSGIFQNSNQFKRFKPIEMIITTTAVLVFCFIAGHFLYTKPYGETLSVALLQGNVPQTLKFDPVASQQYMRLYAELAANSTAQLTVMPETALPSLFNNLTPDIFNTLKTTPGTLVIGSVGKYGTQYTNRLETPFILPTSIATSGKKPPQTAVKTKGKIKSKPNNINNNINTGNLGVGTDGKPSYWVYDKAHLVPFGESIPTGFDALIAMMHLPLSGLAQGADNQPNLEVKGLSIATNICYEELFAHEWHERAARAHILLNASNFGWYGNSAVFAQHTNIARMRALEFQKPYLSATNNGATITVKPTGEVNRVSVNTAIALNDTVQGMAGLTPYAWWGDFGIVGLSLLLLLWVFWRRNPKIIYV